MQILFLGTGAADWPNPGPKVGKGRRFSSLLLNQTILIDCGPMALDAIREFDVNVNLITDIVIGHGHGDHINTQPRRWRHHTGDHITKATRRPLADTQSGGNGGNFHTRARQRTAPMTATTTKPRPFITTNQRPPHHSHEPTAHI